MKNKNFVIFFVLFFIFSSNFLFLDDIRASNPVKRILIDNFHSRGYAEEKFPELIIELENLGYSIEYSNSVLIFSDLKNYSALLICTPNLQYSMEEKNSIYEFVNNGGGLLIIGEVGSYSKEYGILPILNDISKEFGIQFNADCINDPSDNMAVRGCPRSMYPIIHITNEHPVTKEVKEFFLGWGCSLICETPAFALAVGDHDTFADKFVDEKYNNSPDPDEERGENVIVLAGSEYGEGKVIAIGDASLWSGKYEERLDEEYISYLDNKRLALNAFDWICQNLIPIELINGDKFFLEAEREGNFREAVKKYETAKEFYSVIDREKADLCTQKIKKIKEEWSVTFSDRNFEDAIREYLGIKSEELIYRPDLTNIPSLSLTNENIQSIEGIEEYCENLQYLNLSNNDISDISPISSLTKLEELNLSNNNISDISPLIANPNLQTGTKVDISNNPLSSKSVELYIPILEGKGIELTWEPIKKISITFSSLKSKSFIYILSLVAITISILAVYLITKKKPKKEVKKKQFKEEIDQKKSKDVKIHKEKRVESSELKQLLKERNELKSILNGLKYHKERLIAEKMSEEEYNRLYKQAIEKLKTIEELILLIKEK